MTLKLTISMVAFPGSSLTFCHTTTKVSLLKSRLTFLTDHLVGLKQESFGGNCMIPKTDWNNGKIYTSVISAKILLNRFSNLKPYVVPLELYTDYQIKGRTVTLLEANHCPGAVMFLFKSNSGIVLHTGDFRFKKAMLPQILKHTEGQAVDFIHMDNTFSTKAEDFPS
jgi:Cft2 family RNA processing exonuclease